MSGIRIVVGMALASVGALVLLSGLFAAVGWMFYSSESKRAYIIFASAGLLVTSFLLLYAAKVCLSVKWSDVLSGMSPQGLVLIGYMRAFLPHIRPWHKWVALIALLFSAGFIWTNLLE